MLQDNLARVEDRIRTACVRSGRRREEVTLIAVTKQFPASVIREAYELGLRDFGENYVQEFESKAPELSGLNACRYHLIGHLQSNKSRRAAELFHVIQTVDSARLARRLNEAAAALDVMIEVKLSPEETKSGVAPELLPSLVEAVVSLPSLRLLGFMTMPPWSDDPEASRPYFARLRELAEKFRPRAGGPVFALSMGMSHDFESAIAEGATHIRVGTALFGRRKSA